MDNTKSALASKTVISQIVGLGAAVITMWGFDLSAEEQASVVTLIVAAQSVAGIIFRIMAERKIRSSK